VKIWIVFVRSKVHEVPIQLAPSRKLVTLIGCLLHHTIHLWLIVCSIKYHYIYWYEPGSPLTVCRTLIWAWEPHAVGGWCWQLSKGAIRNQTQRFYAPMRPWAHLQLSWTYLRLNINSKLGPRPQNWNCAHICQPSWPSQYHPGPPTLYCCGAVANPLTSFPMVWAYFIGSIMHVEALGWHF
jgi:hypothetical protein